MGPLRLLVLPVLLASALLVGVPASAQVTPLGASPAAPASVLNTFAYDDLNHVYLQIWEYNRDVLGRFIGSNGTVLGASFIAAPYKQSFAGKPKVAFGSGKFLLIYSSDVNQFDTGSNAFGQFITYTGVAPYGGTLVGAPIFLSPNSGVGTKVQVTTDVVYNPLTQRFLVAYDEIFSGNREAMVRPFAASDGAALANAVNLSNGPGWQGTTALACDWELNKYFAVYMGENPANTSQNGIFARVIDGNSLALSSHIVVAIGFTIEPAAAFMPEADGFLAAWTAFNSTRDVMARFVPSSYSGSLPLAAYGIVAQPGDNEGAGALDYDYRSRRILVGAMSDTFRIVGSLLDAAGGNPVWPFYLSTTISTSGSFFPVIRPAENGIFGLSYINDYLWVYLERYQLPLASTPGPQCCTSATFNVSPTAWTPVAAGGTQLVTVTSSVAGAPWTATSGAPAWLTTSVAGGTGSGSVTLTAAANGTSAARNASVVVAGQAVAVTQAGSGDVLNGNFSGGLTGWTVFAVPTGAMVTSVVGGVLEFYRTAPPPGTTGQGSVYQSTGQGLGAATPIAADFDIGNSSTARKRVTVLLHDSNFSDLYMCTFWLAPGAPLRTYRIRTHTNQAWANTTISFYTATTGASGGAYRLDNVRVYSTPGQSVERTDCVDPTTPAPQAFPDSADLMTNGSFAAGLSPWSTFGQITSQITGGVFQFARPAGTPAGVVLQPLNTGLPLHTPLTLVLSLGNSSTVRKRVAVLIHDADFSDLGACTFWIEPGQALAAHTVKMYTTEAWTNATVSVYPSMVSAEQWVLLDNASLKVTMSAPLLGTECIEPPGLPPPAPAFSAPGAGVLPPKDATSPVQTDPQHGGIWSAVVAGTETHALMLRAPIDLRDASSGYLLFESWLSAGPSVASVEVSRDGLTWERVALVPPSDDWTTVAVDLSAYVGDVIFVRFVYAGVAPERAAAEAWHIRGVSVETRLPRTPQSRLQRPR